MIDGLSVLALITARGGSKGIPGKNVKLLDGRPMIDYSIQAGLQSKYVDAVVVTTDDEEIARISRECGAEIPFMRPAELAADTSKSVDAVIHARDTLQGMGRSYDILVLLQPTSPLRTAADIDEALELFVKMERMDLVAVVPVEETPIHMHTMDENGVLHPIMNMNGTIRRQDMPAFYRVNGAIYINNAAELSLETSFNDNPLGFVMSKEHSVDIDEIEDFEKAERILQSQR